MIVALGVAMTLGTALGAPKKGKTPAKGTPAPAKGSGSTPAPAPAKGGGDSEGGLGPRTKIDE